MESIFFLQLIISKLIIEIKNMLMRLGRFVLVHLCDNMSKDKDDFLVSYYIKFVYLNKLYFL